MGMGHGFPPNTSLILSLVFPKFAFCNDKRKGQKREKLLKFTEKTFLE